METYNFKFKNKDGEEVNTYKWEGKEGSVKAVIQIAHGMAETAIRYERFAKELVKAGYKVYANDHRGHGLTAKNIDDVGFISEADGFLDMIEDMHQLTNIIKEENKGLPIILLGHSMGSFLSQRYLELYPQALDGLILVGSNGDQGAIISLGIVLSKIEMLLRGKRARSNMMNKLSFGNFNKAFSPTRTEFDWLSRDEKEVDKYIENPYCGGIFTTSYFYYFLKGLKAIHKRENLERIPKDIPIYIFSGDMDPVGNYGKGVSKLISTYKELGVKNLHYKLYKDGRHEILNETNREEVMKDVIVWLDNNFCIKS